MHAIFARLRRENRLSEEDFNAVKAAFDKDWEALVRLQIVDAVLHRAGDLADDFALRGYDSVQLAAAEHLRTGSGRPVLFAGFDRCLNEGPHAFSVANYWMASEASPILHKPEIVGV